MAPGVGTYGSVATRKRLLRGSSSYVRGAGELKCSGIISPPTRSTSTAATEPSPSTPRLRDLALLTVVVSLPRLLLLASKIRALGIYRWAGRRELTASTTHPRATAPADARTLRQLPCLLKATGTSSFWGAVWRRRSG
jgi:hypothetical protein